ncbi:cytochrome P450 [Aspergillus ambiguus]|uniref:cytochrome P450 n=1 Tax=Aspergillus ambiguus TaxID=176160 RepID=UPI003CCCDDB2
MGGYEISKDVLIQSAQTNLRELGWLVLCLVIAICISTRIITGLQSRTGARTMTTNARPVRTVAYWVPWLGHGISFVWDHVALIEKARDSLKEPALGIYMGGTKHNVVVSPSLVKTVMLSRSTSSAALINYALKTVGGDRGTIRNFNAADHHVFHHNLPNLFMREPFTTEASTKLVQLLQREVANFVTFCWSPVDQTPWERSSAVVLADRGDKPTCEASLFALIRGFVGHITTTTLMGRAILEAFPSLLDDVWALDNRFPLLAMGLPRWLPIPGLSAACAGRDRILEALAAYQKAFVDMEDGIEGDVKLRDFDDVSEPMKQRIRMSKNMGLSAKDSAPGHLSLFWAMNGNSPNVAFWHLLRLYTNPNLLDEVRQEISPYVKAWRPTREETGFPIPEAPKISMDFEAMFRNCHLFKASFYETMRMDSAGLSFRELTSDLIIAESKADAAVAGLSEPRSFYVNKGESIAVPHGVLHNDPRYFSNPDQFDPLRFIVTDPETGSQRAELHTIYPFGGGASGCKGRVFAEREILAFVAAIISMWNIEPADGKDFTLPKHRPSSGAYLPSSDIRVRLSMRV